MMVETDFTELVHEDKRPRECPLEREVIQDRGLATAQKPVSTETAVSRGSLM